MGGLNQGHKNNFKELLVKLPRTIIWLARYFATLLNCENVLQSYLAWIIRREASEKKNLQRLNISGFDINLKKFIESLRYSLRPNKYTEKWGRVLMNLFSLIRTAHIPINWNQLILKKIELILINEYNYIY